MQENPVKDLYWQISLLIFPFAIIYLLFFRFSPEVLIIFLTLSLVLGAFQYIRMKKFYFKLTNECIEVKQLGYGIFEIPYDSITRLYIYQSPYYKFLKVSGLSVEFSKRHDLKEQLLFGGPAHNLNESLFSPGIVGDYFCLPYISLLDAERIKNNILEKCREPKPEVKYIGMLHP